MKLLSYGLSFIACLALTSVGQVKKDAPKAQNEVVWEATIKGIGG